MATDALARDKLWDIADLQHGFVTAQQARESGISQQAMQMLVYRGTLVSASHGVYRFPKYPIGEHDQEMLAVLWTRAPEAAISHETALDLYELTDVNPDVIHVTVAKRRRLRRSGNDRYVIHYEDLDAHQIGWSDEIPSVTPATAIAQCIAGATPTYLLRQALERGLAQGRIKTARHNELNAMLASRHER